MTTWFARVDLSPASIVERRVVQKVSDLLDQLQPARLDPAAQVVEFDHGETWVRLQHDSDPGMKIEIAVCGDRANFYGVMGHDECYSANSEAPDAWESDTIDTLAELLLADYTFNSYDVRGSRWRDVVTIGGSYDTTCIGGPMPMSLLPLRRWANHIRTHESSFECRNTRPAS